MQTSPGSQTVERASVSAAEGVVASVVAGERHARDRGDWERMGRAYHPDSVVRLAWFHGSGPEFVEASRRGGRGGTTKHRLSPSIVDVRGDRAVAETTVLIETRTVQDGVDVDLFSSCRYLTLLRCDARAWLISRVDCICEKDWIRTVVPGQSLVMDTGRLAGYRPSYRFVSYNLASHGIDPPSDVPGDDEPGPRDVLYADARAWLGS